MKDNIFKNYIKSLETICSFDSRRKSPCFESPFGKDCFDVANSFLNIASSLGFKNIQNKSGYYAYIDINTDKFNESLGILGHLDIVPFQKEDWLFDPLTLTFKNAAYYARGVVDDKGPILACLYAIYDLINEGKKQKRGIRLIVGLDEETNSECMKKYHENNELVPSFSFTPDAAFPCIFAEKTIIHAFVTVNMPKCFRSIQGGQAINIVADKVSAIEANTNKEITIEGLAAHGSKPDVGVNAFIKLLEMYKDIDTECNNLYNCIKDTNGKSLGINTYVENIGSLTVNIGIIKTIKDRLSFSLDIRSPKNNVNEIINTIENKLNVKLDNLSISPGIEIDPNSFLVSTLVNSYKKITGDLNAIPMASGGGTYAKHMPNCVAFGPQFSDMSETIHQANENFPIEYMKLMYDVYKDAIWHLAFEV